MEENDFQKMSDLKISLEYAKELYHNVPDWFQSVLRKNFGVWNFYQPQDIKNFSDCCAIVQKEVKNTYTTEEEITIIVNAYNKARLNGHRVDISYKSNKEYYLPAFIYNDNGTFVFCSVLKVGLNSTYIMCKQSLLFLNEFDAAFAGQLFVQKYEQYYV